MAGIKYFTNPTFLDLEVDKIRQEVGLGLDYSISDRTYLLLNENKEIEVSNFVLENTVIPFLYKGEKNEQIRGRNEILISFNTDRDYFNEKDKLDLVIIKHKNKKIACYNWFITEKNIHVYTIQIKSTCDFYHID